jgi:hypothetical protein
MIILIFKFQIKHSITSTASSFLYQPILLFLFLMCLFSRFSNAAGDLPTLFSNSGGITNTRHNLTQNPIGSGSTMMDRSRNNYNEVCVYCHTPHGANTKVAAPLWNRTASAGPYKTYEQGKSSTFSGTVSSPGNNSITCLSCHDGTLGVDSIINMPGSGKYSEAQESSQSNSFLNDNWDNTSGIDANLHVGLNAETTGDGCLACHDVDAGLVAGDGATDFTAMALGTDLTNDHPVGVLFPVAEQGNNFNTLTFTKDGIGAYDNDLSGNITKGDIRVYDTGQDLEVECASCHDPHGVPSLGPGSVNFPSFLRVSNSESKVCLTCHNK